METRAKLSSQLATMEAATSREEEAVAKMNEEKMIRALNSNVKLGCLQSVFDKVVMVTALELETNLCEDGTFTITEKAPARAFSWLKASTNAFTIKNLLRHCTMLNGH